MLSASRIKKIEDILPSSRIISSPAALLTYSTDASNLIGSPDIAVLPRNTEEVSKLLAWSYKERATVIPRGSGTGVTGGAVPVSGGMVLCLSQMDRILEIDRSNMLAVVEPGVITGDLQDEVEKLGLFYPPDPSSLKACTIGGNIAENAGGPKALKYGVTRDYCLGLEIALLDGQILHTGTRTQKSVVGYDLTRLLVGSEGTLGVITKVFLRLIHRPDAVCTMQAKFSSVEKAVAAINEIFRMGIIPSVMELMDEKSIKCVSSYLDLDFPKDKGAMLLIEVDGKPDNVREQADRIKTLLTCVFSEEVEEALTEEDREGIINFRRSISPAIYRIGKNKINEDICVPRDRLADCFGGLQKIAEKFDLKMANFGHAGDGNIHVNIMIDDKTKDGARAEAAVREIFKMTLAMGGTISGEHGIGVTKAPYLGMELDASSIRIMKEIKASFDPLGLLNPGKIFHNHPQMASSL
ncbi:FAD-binding protein [bacterium]|nr:FAD-binding protein [bacterium]